MLTWFAQKIPWLRRAYVLPQLLDTVLLACTLVRHPARARAMHALEHEVLRWPGVSACIHRYGGTEFRLGRREIGHLHGHGLLDILFTRAVREEVVLSGAAKPHHIFPQSAWVSFEVNAAEDVPAALTLLRRNYDRMKSESIV